MVCTQGISRATSSRSNAAPRPTAAAVSRHVVAAVPRPEHQTSAGNYGGPTARALPSVCEGRRPAAARRSAPRRARKKVGGA